MADFKDDDLELAQQKLLNGVGYESLAETTIAVSRTFERQYFQKNDYSPSNNEAICDWNTGAKLVGRRSYLTFRVKSNIGEITSLGRGSALNFIKRIVITTRSGVELSRTEDFNLLMCKLLRYECSAEYLASIGEGIGFNPTGAAWTAASAAHGEQRITTAGRVFVIPLDLVSPFFAGDGKTLLPPQAAAGLRVQITFAPFLDAVAAVTNVATTYAIDQISFQLNTTMLVDSWQRQLNEESARDGLTYTYPEWHTTQASVPGTRMNVEVRKAVARALVAFVVTRSVAIGVAVDNMASEPYTATSYEYRLGSMYPTQQPIQTAEEAYYIAQSMFDGGVLDCKRPNGVSIQDFTGKNNDVGLVGDAVVATSLERNDVAVNGTLNIGGLPTNNSRVLNADITFAAAIATRQAHLFMKHLRVAKFFLDNSVISE